MENARRDANTAKSTEPAKYQQVPVWPKQEYMRYEPPETCPPPGTQEYEAFVERQAGGAFIDALNFHPILRVMSTIAIVVFGSASLLTALAILWEQPGIQKVGAIWQTIFGISLFSLLRFSWGRRRRDWSPCNTSATRD